MVKGTMCALLAIAIFNERGGFSVSSDALHFENFELDRNAYRLSRGGETVRLERIPRNCCFY